MSKKLNFIHTFKLQRFFCGRQYSFNYGNEFKINSICLWQCCDLILESFSGVLSRVSLWIGIPEKAVGSDCTSPIFY